MRNTLPIALVVLLSACASRPPAISDGLHWFRDSAEQKAIYAEVYASATSAVRAASAGLAAGTWAVILDVDETILDNSDNEKQQALSVKPYDDKSWDVWVEQRKAPLLPGAKAFIDTVHGELKGRVVLVTNRPQAQCGATEDNLRAHQIPYDQILCDRVGDGNKNERFRSVTDTFNVLLWVGDNIRDFPGLTQQKPGDPSQFGKRYFVLPNTMYGSWTGVPPR